MFFKEYVYGDNIRYKEKEVLKTSKNPEKALIYPDKTADTFYDDYSSVTIIADSNTEVFVITHDGHTYQGIYGGFVNDGEVCIRVKDVVLAFSGIIFLGSIF